MATSRGDNPGSSAPNGDDTTEETLLVTSVRDDTQPAPHRPAAPSPDRPRVLDLCCCAGGASTGYHRAGFDVVGVDVAPRPNYPFTFVRADAVAYVRDHGHAFDLIHASWPCQATCALTKGTNAHLAARYEDLLPAGRAAMESTGTPYVIENPEARADVVLCGAMFDLGVLRHRRFELGGWTTPKPRHRRHQGRVRGWRHGEWHDGPYVAAYGKGGGKATVPEMQVALGIDWTDVHEELTEAIPPAFTEWIGRRFLSRTTQLAAFDVITEAA